MKTEKIEVYCISELDEKAQEKAHESYLHDGFEYHWIDESLSSVRVFLDGFGAKLTDYSLSTYGGHYLKSDISHELVRGLKKRDLPKKDAELSGYCLDFTLTDSLHANLKNGDILSAIQAALNKAELDILADMEYQESFECFKETSVINQWGYLSSGQFWG